MHWKYEFKPFYTKYTTQKILLSWDAMGEITSSDSGSEKKNKKSIVNNPTLQGWIAIIAFPLAIISLYLTYISIKQVRPVYGILADVVLTSNFYNSKVIVYYDSVEVQNVRAVTVVLWNAGNDFLSKETIKEGSPISIKSSKPVSILEVRVLKTTRPYLKFIPTYHVDSVLGTPTDTASTLYDYVSLEMEGDEALEADDGASFTILYTSPTDCEWYVDAGIKGVPEGFTKAIGTQLKFTFFMSFLILPFVWFMVHTFITYVHPVESQKTRKRIFTILFIVLFLILIFYIFHIIIPNFPIAVDPPEGLYF